MDKTATEASICLFIARHLVPRAGEIMSPGALAVEGEKILACGTPEELKRKYPQAKESLFWEQALLPGLVNAHADLSLTHFQPSSDLPYETQDGRFLLMPWLIQISRFKSKLLPQAQQQAVRDGLQTLLTSGTTTVGDVCRYPVAIPLYEASQLRVVCLAEIENIQRRLAQEEFEQALALIDEIQHGRNPRLSAGLAPFSAYTLSKNLLRILGSHALQQGIPLHLQAALSFSEMEFFYDSLGEVSSVLFREAGWQDKIPPPHHMTPIQYLYEIGLLKAQPSLVGCLHLGPSDAALLDEAGCVRIFAPQAFARLQAGKADWEKLALDKSPWALATLGKAAGTSLDLWDEMRLALSQVSQNCDREAVAASLLHAATLGAARALGLEQRVGSLVTDKAADFILVDAGPSWSLTSLLETTRARHVQAAYVAGECVYQRTAD